MTRIIKAGESDPSQPRNAAVLRLADLAAEARSLVLDARKEAARIVADARAKAEDSQRQANEKGYADGYARGQQSGYTDGRKQALTEARKDLAAEAAEVLPLARKAVEELARARAEFVERAGREIVQLAVAIAEKVIGRLARADLRAARENLTKALALASRSAQWTVLVHPAQMEALQRHFPQWTQSLGLSGEVRWAADEQIAPGGVKVRSPRGEIDATIDAQLANVAEALIGPGASAREAEAGEDGSYVSQPRDGGVRPGGADGEGGRRLPARVIRPIQTDAPPGDSDRV